MANWFSNFLDWIIGEPKPPEVESAYQITFVKNEVAKPKVKPKAKAKKPAKKPAKKRTAR